MKEGYNSVVSLNDLLLKVNLGVADNEMNTPQDVLVSFKLFFKDIPTACESDNIDEAICYYEISKLIKNYCEGKSFRLLEYLCFQLYKEIKSTIGNSAKLWIRVDKCKPPVEDLKGTTSFEYGD